MTTRIVILGGGFAGVSTAQALAKRLRKERRLVRPGADRSGPLVPGSKGGSSAVGRDRGVSVTVLARDNHFVFQPLLADIISGAIETTHVVVPLRRMLRDVEVEVGQIESVDTAARLVHMVRRQSGQPFTVSYDALVVALGSVTDFRTVPGMAEHALGVRTMGDAFYLRNRALSMLEEAATEPDEARRRRLLTFVVVGGGSTGVEVAAELHDLVRNARRTIAGLPEPEVILVHSRPFAVQEFGERLSRYATRKLGDMGVRLLLGRRLVSVTEEGVELDDGSMIPASTVVSTVGNAPHPVVARLVGGADGGWIHPDATFAVPGLERVWALGDCASIVDPRTGARMPSTAQHAIREGPQAAANVLAVLRPARHAGIARQVQGRGRAPGHQGLRVHRLVPVADLLPAAPADLGSSPARGPRLDTGAAVRPRRDRDLDATHEDPTG
jgi:NADH dehydrogenase